MKCTLRWPALWLSVGSSIFALLIGELGARTFLNPPPRVDTNPMRKNESNGKALHSLHRPDPVLGWVLTSEPMEYRHRLANQDGVVQYDVVYSVVNGMRRTSAHPPDGPAVIAAGCSFTLGHGLNDQDSWPWLLQEQLPQYRVLNAAAMAYGTDQALLAAERQVKRSPQHTMAVVLGLGDFQIDRNSAVQGWMVYVYPFSKPLFAMGPDSAEYRCQVRFWSLPVLSRSDLFAHAMNVLANRVYYGVPSHEEAKKLTAALIKTFARRFQALGVRLAVVILPYAGDQGARPRADRTFLIESLHAAGIPVLMLDFPRLPNGQFNVRRYMVSSIDRHPNREYNRTLVDQLRPFLESNGIISR